MGLVVGYQADDGPQFRTGACPVHAPKYKIVINNFLYQWIDRFPSNPVETPASLRATYDTTTSELELLTGRRPGGRPPVGRAVP